jgi:hypothetical protein
LIGEVDWKAKVAATARKTYANKKTKAALDEAKRKAMLGTELESVAQQPPAPPPAVGLGRIRWPEDQSWNAFQRAHCGGGRKTRADWIHAAARPPPLPSQAEADLREREQAKKDRINLMARERGKRTRALIREERKAILKTEQESVAQEPLPDITQPPLQPSSQPPPSLQAPSFLQEPLPGIRQPPLQPSFQPPPSLHPLPRSDLWTIVDMHG